MEDHSGSMEPVKTEVLVSVAEAQATFDEIVAVAVDLGVRRARLRELVARGVEEAHWVVLGYEDKKGWQQAIADKAEVKLITVIGWETHRNQVGGSHKKKREQLATQSEIDNENHYQAPGPTWSEAISTDLVEIADAELRPMLNTFSSVEPARISGIFAASTKKQLDPLRRAKRRFELLAAEAGKRIAELDQEG